MDSSVLLSELLHACMYNLHDIVDPFRTGLPWRDVRLVAWRRCLASLIVPFDYGTGRYYMQRHLLEVYLY